MLILTSIFLFENKVLYLQPNNIVRNKYEQINNIPMKINNLLSTSTGGGLNWDVLLEQYQREFDTHSPMLM